MLKMIKGVKINCADKLEEEYEIKDNCLLANINEDKILKIINDFTDLQRDSLFLILEVPSNLNKEKTNGTIINQFHKDVYYIDNMSKEYTKEILNSIGSLFVNDGLGQIGIGNHATNAEIMTNKYNVITIFKGKDDLLKYENILVNNKINKVDSLLTAWDYINDDNPGERNLIESEGKTIYDVVEILKQTSNLYFAEQRED